ncbi:hypothetical protein NA78x_000291 [Anatilimnocola sp. NA78]|uniref:hypothetical protein n=1 Tax=Anatilimnocola sp. NA78 TaxID=3415683 RepID=UPI003CE4C46E
MVIVYSAAIFTACGLFLASCFYGSMRRGSESDIARIRARFGLGTQWIALLRFAAYVQLGAMALATITFFALAAFCLATLAA